MSKIDNEVNIKTASERFVEWKAVTNANEVVNRGANQIRALSKPITDKQIKQAAKNIHMTNAVEIFELRQFVDALMDEIQN